VTLRQLRIFATVARLGSVKAAARELAISEPAVSASVGGLRRELGDDLYARAGGALVLTSAGRRLASLATDITELADHARLPLDETQPQGTQLLHVAVSSSVEQHAVGPLLSAFISRTRGTEVAVAVESPQRFAELIERRRTDITLGPRPPLEAARHLVVVPFLRCMLVVVASAGHRLAGRSGIVASELADERWLVGPGGDDPSTPTGAFFSRHRLAPPDVRAFPSDASALYAVGGGEGVMLALSHTLTEALRHQAIARLDVRGTPVVDRWYATTLPEEQAPAAALALRRFALSREATQTMAAPGHGVPAARLRAPVHATLWGSVAREAPGSARASEGRAREA